jgi:hypothetical protein
MTQINFPVAHIKFLISPIPEARPHVLLKNRTGCWTVYLKFWLRNHGKAKLRSSYLDVAQLWLVKFRMFFSWLSLQLGLFALKLRLSHLLNYLLLFFSREAGLGHLYVESDNNSFTKWSNELVSLSYIPDTKMNMYCQILHPSNYDHRDPWYLTMYKNIFHYYTGCSHEQFAWVDF